MNHYKEMVVRRVSAMEKFNRYADRHPFKTISYLISIIVTLIIMGVI